MDLISLLVVVILTSLIYWAVHRVASTFGLSPQIVTLLDILLVVLFVVYLLSWLGWVNVPLRR